MEYMDDNQFTAWLSDYKIGVDPKYAKTSDLAFLACPDYWYSWSMPKNLKGIHKFLSIVLDLDLPIGPYWLYHRGGGAWYENELVSQTDSEINNILNTIKVATDFRGAIGFGNEELEQLKSVLTVFIKKGWHIGHDIYIVPNNRSFFLMTSHHEDLYGHFPTIESQEAFQKKMFTAGYGSEE